MAKPGDVCVAPFPGVMGVKRRPCIVVLTDLYHANRPDVVLCLVTTQTASATTPLDYVIQDWTAAGLHQPSAMRSFLFTLPEPGIMIIGHLSDRDWQEVQVRLKLAIAVP